MGFLSFSLKWFWLKLRNRFIRAEPSLQMAFHSLPQTTLALFEKLKSIGRTFLVQLYYNMTLWVLCFLKARIFSKLKTPESQSGKRNRKREECGCFVASLKLLNSKYFETFANFTFYFRSGWASLDQSFDLKHTTPALIQKFWNSLS